MIEVRNLKKRFGDKWVSKGINIKIPRGKMTCIIGRSGEGKSVLEAVRWANAAGAIAATKLGAQPSLPSREELDNFIWHQPRVEK